MTQEERDIFRMNAYGWACRSNSAIGHTDKLANMIYESVASSTHKKCYDAVTYRFVDRQTNPTLTEYFTIKLSSESKTWR